MMQYVHLCSEMLSLVGSVGSAGKQTEPWPIQKPAAVPSQPCTAVGVTGRSCVLTGLEATQPSSTTSGATVTDAVPPAIASYVVQLPSQALGGSNAVPAPGAMQL